MIPAMSVNSTQERLRVGADHPALPGHFPGRPVVPGVVLLDRVAAAIEREFGTHVTGFTQVKFSSPLLPEQDAELQLERAGENVRFRILREAMTVANGIVEVGAPA
jgi:3-hydroxyacyl-[acyl-carrier-protein] dehydratase